MMFKKKCPVCGAKNSKERTACIECGALFASRQVEGQVAQVSTEGETQKRKGLYKAIEQTTAHKKSAWFWVGVALLSISALWWLIIILVPGDIGDTILVGVVTTIVPIGIAVYCVRRGRKSPPAEIHQKPKPTYVSRQMVMMTQEMEAAPERAYRTEPTAKPKSSIDRYAVQDTKKIRKTKHSPPKNYIGQCTNHPDAYAVETCIHCGKSICAECAIFREEDEEIYCISCMEKLFPETPLI